MANRSDDPRKLLQAPALEDLQAYADGRLDPARVADLELYLSLHPDYQALVETYRAPDPRLQAAYTEKLDQLIAAEQKTAQTLWQKWAAIVGSWFQMPMGRAGLVAAVLLLASILLLREQSQGVPEYEALSGTQVRSGDDGVKRVGEILTEVKPSTASETNLEYELIAKELALLPPGPHRLKPGSGKCMLIQMSFDAGIQEAEVTAVLKSVVASDTFPDRGVDGKVRVLQAFKSANLSPNSLTVSDVYRVKD